MGWQHHRRGADRRGIALGGVAAVAAGGAGAGPEPRAEPGLEPEPEPVAGVLVREEHVSAGAAPRPGGTSPAPGDVIKRLSQSAPPASASLLATQTSQFGDLNRASEQELEMAKARMSTGFEATRLRPGDAGYQYDVRVDFAPAGDDAGSWDDESDWDDDDD